MLGRFALDQAIEQGPGRLWRKAQPLGKHVPRGLRDVAKRLLRQHDAVRAGGKGPHDRLLSVGEIHSQCLDLRPAALHCPDPPSRIGSDRDGQRRLGRVRVQPSRWDLKDIRTLQPEAGHDRVPHECAVAEHQRTSLAQAHPRLRQPLFWDPCTTPRHTKA
jgi:hypothetical protein